MNRNYYEVAMIVLLLGLFPAFFLPILQLVLFIVLLGLVASYQNINSKKMKQVLSLRYLMFAQFCILFFINALIYPDWSSPKTHYRAIALESWSLSLLCVVILGLWLSMCKAGDIKRGILQWLPVGLTATFAIASWIYVSGSQGSRIQLLTPNPLVLPLWFLVLTAASFSWFFEMNRSHKVWRIVLFFMAGMMALYGGARLITLVWMLCGVALIIWGYVQSPPKYRLQVLIATSLLGIATIAGVAFFDFLSGGMLYHRMAVFGQVELTYESISTRFRRAIIWTSALSVISDNVLMGIGQVNERLSINQEAGWNYWFRAHQTYLSYLVAGGIPALISGLLMQSPVLVFLKRRNRAALFPAFLGLGFVVTMNCLTDSIFQSGVSVQAFMLTTLLFLRASDTDQPTLTPQKHVSSVLEISPSSR